MLMRTQTSRRLGEGRAGGPTSSSGSTRQQGEHGRGRDRPRAPPNVPGRRSWLPDHWHGRSSGDWFVTAPTGRHRPRRALALVMGLIAGLVGLVSMAPPSSGVAPAATPPAGPSPTSTSSTAPPTATSTTSLASTAETSTAPPVRTPAVPGPPVVPAPGSAYLGAFVDPSGQALSGVTPLGGAGGVAAELASLPSVEQGLGRPLSIVEVDQGWGVPVDTAQLGRVAATGAVPMVTWECGDTDADVIAGADDALDHRVRPSAALPRCTGPGAVVPRSQCVGPRHAEVPG